MKYYYLYSPGYKYWSDRLQSSLPPCFEPIGYKIAPILNNPDQKGSAFKNNNSTTKIELVIESIKNNLGDYIVFSDANFLVIKNNVQKYRLYLDEQTKLNCDIMFADNQFGQVYNIGLMLIKCNNQVLQFFKDCVTRIKNCDKGCGWDQGVIQQMLFPEHIQEQHNIKHLSFDKHHVWTSPHTDFISKYKGNKNKDLYAIKFWSDHCGSEQQIFERRLNFYKMYDLV